MKPSHAATLGGLALAVGTIWCLRSGSGADPVVGTESVLGVHPAAPSSVVSPVRHVRGEEVPEDALNQLQASARIADFDVRFETRRSLLASLARVDGRGAIAYVASLPEAERWPELEAIVLKAWTRTAPEEGVAWFVARQWERDGDLLAAALGDALSALSLNHVSALAKAIPDESARLAVAGAVVRRWEQRRPAEAAELVVTVADEPGRRNLLGGILAEWAQVDAHAAAQWVRRQPEGDTRAAALAHLATTWAAHDAPAAAEFARQLSPGDGPFLGVLASLWVEQDPAAASSWALAQSPANAPQVLSSLSAAWARRDPQAAARFADGLASGPEAEAAVLSVASAWAEREPEAAARWIGRFPDGPVRRQAIGSVADRWIESDPIAAIAWQRALPFGTDRDAVFQASAGSLVRQYPDLALLLALEIADPLVREEQVERAAVAWLAAAPDAARTWLTGATLPSTLQRRILPQP